MALSQSWQDVTLDPPYKKTGEVFDQTTIEGILNCLYALGGTDGTSGFGIPIGAQVPYSGSSVPNGGFWKLCDGAAIDRTVYGKLFGLQGTTYGAGNGSTTFNLPDKRGRTSFGADNMGTGAGGHMASNNTRGAAAGFETQTLTTTQMPAHNHSFADPGHAHSTPGNAGGSQPGEPANSSLNLGVGSVNSNTTGITVAMQGSGAAFNQMPPYGVDSWIIRVL